jgi:nucleoside-diphosphate-sugar epimerase
MSGLRVLFLGGTGIISSACSRLAVERGIELFAYQTPPSRVPVTESTPLRNPYLQYSRDKIACEELLRTAYRDDGFPVTIVRPSHTYDKTSVPLHGGWTAVARMRQGKPVVVHGDGTSLWTLTQHEDFAQGFVPLLPANRVVIPFEQGAREIVAWYDEDPARQRIDAGADAITDKLAQHFRPGA